MNMEENILILLNNVFLSEENISSEVSQRETT